MSAIKKIVCYPNLLPFEPTEQNTNIFMEAMAETSVTHVQVNHLPDLMHPEHLHQPSNVYLWFANFGPCLLYTSPHERLGTAFVWRRTHHGNFEQTPGRNL